MKIELCEGKYTYILDEDTGVQEVWKYETINGTGHVLHSEIDDDFGLIFAMAQRIVELEQRVEDLMDSEGGL